MKAIEIINYGEPDVARVRTVERPNRRSGEVLIQVVASSINPVDIKHMTPGTIQKINSFPMVLGWDISGIVIEADKQSSFSLGERVVALHPKGSWQQVISIPENQLIKLPDSIDFISGASVPLASSTALQALRRLQLSSNENLLVIGAAGSVGYYALQIAKEMGITVAGLVRNEDQKSSIESATTKIYTINESLPEFDAVFDTAGVLDRIDFIRKGGKLVTVSDDTIAPQVIAHTSFADHNYVKVNPADLSHIVRLISEGKIKTRIAKSYPFNDVQTALTQAKRSGNKGKIMLVF